MIAKVYKSNDRGIADYGWLKANYSFSFSNYFNSEKMNFGALRVLNDDFIQGGMGFGMHPHENMEIISIPLKGGLKHRDSMFNKWISLEEGEVQVMSAGTGIEHSEMNNHPTEEVNLFQIWIVPNKQNVTPSYNQKKFNGLERKNKLQVLVSSIEHSVEGALTIHQNAQVSRINLSENLAFKYQLKSKNNGVYIMVIEGEVLVDNKILNKRDALGVYNTDVINLKANFSSDILFIEVPM